MPRIRAIWLEATARVFPRLNFEGAKEQFYSIEWDEYSKYAYPDAAIMYYQMESIIIFFSKIKTYPEFDKLEYDQCLRDALQRAPMIQDIICKYYPERAEEYRGYVAGYANEIEKFYKARYIQHEYDVEEYQEYFTPLALQAKQRAERERQAQASKESNTPANDVLVNETSDNAPGMNQSWLQPSDKTNDANHRRGSTPTP